ncbi:hypothetical protein GVN16_08270 [Emticicia sp. CRIBPO]|uniref:LytR/AlgR family response regulator transcription factor n=1 Tax=Emticicia sp. CRIBPO TaxID=2683258 RepID=UPI001412E806|nr:LytTR family DNA-binding domain-containing protein [Emticicia sp. CRIBPO]NBA85750.1 hypothetical protein [Emticicia sp. CRIBPO]
MNNPMMTISQLLEKKKLFLLVIALSVLVLMGIAQDYLEASFHQYSFYISESLLFKSFWLFFIPVAWFFTRFEYLLSNKWYLRLLTVFLLSLAHVILFALTLHFMSALSLPHTYSFIWAVKKTIAEDVYKYIAFYGLLVYWNSRNQTVAAAPVSEAGYEKVLLIASGKKNITVPVSEITCIVSDSPYIAVYTRHEKHLYNSSLKELMLKLDPVVFIKVHRSSIVNIRQVVSFKSRLNGDYDIELKNGKTVRMSRSFSKDFRQRFQ